MIFIIIDRAQVNKMKVHELINQLRKLPQEANVLYEGGEYKDDYRDVRQIKYEDNLGWGKSGVLLK